jgi:hypothetical protein
MRLGEVLWDLLPPGKTMGGAPANFAYMTSVLGDQALRREHNPPSGPYARNHKSSLLLLGGKFTAFELAFCDLETARVEVQLSFLSCNSASGCHRDLVSAS